VASGEESPISDPSAIATAELAGIPGERDYRRGRRGRGGEAPGGRARGRSRAIEKARQGTEAGIPPVAAGVGDDGEG